MYLCHWSVHCSETTLCQQTTPGEGAEWMRTPQNHENTHYIDLWSSVGQHLKQFQEGLEINEKHFLNIWWDTCVPWATLVTGLPSFSHIRLGKGTPEASQSSLAASLTTTATVPPRLEMVGGTKEHKKRSVGGILIECHIGTINTYQTLAGCKEALQLQPDWQPDICTRQRPTAAPARSAAPGLASPPTRQLHWSEAGHLWTRRQLKHKCTKKSINKNHEIK